MPIFVVQRHDARGLHFDFRLEVVGVLASWAVPRGPSLDPKEKRLAVMTEDHSMDYADFEGVIGQGEYGAGTVIVWDTGSYENLTRARGKPVSTAEGIRRGHIKVRLYGRRMVGAWALTRTGGPTERAWLLVKVKDEYADPGRDLTAERDSVLSGLTNDDLLPADAAQAT